MHPPLIVDDKLVAEARIAATVMGKNLNQLVNNYLETMIHEQKSASSFAEFAFLSGQSKQHTWSFNRDELHERT
ncbi:hypothetical protein [uncultured Thiothrix sp.]|uniref:hypothetical protein n=1 Tax=uncultured Thiothrix sp. TaxID=223185 RepID=UPI0026220E26|nr:hypothetical protein [uncultured Thiothrix sp.]